MSTEAGTFESLQPYSPIARYTMLTVVIVPFLATIFAISQLWQRAVYGTDLIIFFVMYVLAGLGITIGYHRMVTHSGFEAPEWLRAIFLFMGAIAVESGPLTWASTHLKHHAHSDKEGDPHSPLEGFFHAHLGWMIDGWDIEPDKHGPWLLKDRLVMFFEKTFVGWVAVGLLIPFLVGGISAAALGRPFMQGAWLGFIWGGLVRIFFTHHVTWSVNSICHTFGKRPFKTKDHSRNNFIVGVLAFGEGWHNNHHAFPNSAVHGLRWWQIDTSAYVIRILETLGLIWDVKRVTPEQMARKSGA